MAHWTLQEEVYFLDMLEQRLPLDTIARLIQRSPDELIDKQRKIAWVMLDVALTTQDIMEMTGLSFYEVDYLRRKKRYSLRRHQKG